MTDSRNSRLSITYACAGHGCMHLLVALYLTAVLGVEGDWRLPYDELIRLWTVGSLLIGLGAPLAGWLGDRWSECRMIVIFFLLTGAGAVWSGAAGTPTSLAVGLAMLGLGASIYHPVGMSWVVRNARNRGRTLGILGIFGGLGVASAALVAGSLTELIHWRAAFIIPGAISIVMGLSLWLLIALGWVYDRDVDVTPDAPVARSAIVRSFVILTATMACGGLIYQSTQVAIPKLFEDRIDVLHGSGVLGVGGLVTIVYTIAAFSQVVGGFLADRVSLKQIYVVGLSFQAVLLAVAATSGGLPLVAIVIAAVFLGHLLFPAENLLLARFTPGRYRGLAYGGKFVLSFGVAPLGVQLVAFVYDRYGDLANVFWSVSAIGVVALVAAMLLPVEATSRRAQAVPAE